MRVLISTGEVSGDIAGALVATEIFRRQPGARIFGIGGARLAQAGVDLEYSTIHLGTVGVSESLAAVPPLLQAIRRIRRRVRAERPDVALLIGNDIFNVILGRWLRARGVVTISWFPPQVWIWRSVAWAFAKSFDVILTSFPDEQRVWERHCRDTVFVGHYLADRLTATTPAERAAARARLFFAPADTVVAVLPGSRRQEVNALTRHFLDAAALLAGQRAIRFAIPVSDACFEAEIRAEVQSRGLSGVTTIVDRQSHDVMRASDVVLAASGTASLEATLLGVPVVTAYQVSAFTLFIVRMAIRAGWMDSEMTALPNLALGRWAVPEVKQSDVGPERLAAEVRRLLDDELARRKMLRDLAEAAAGVRAYDSVGQVTDSVFAHARASAVPILHARVAGAGEEPGHDR